MALGLADVVSSGTAYVGLHRTGALAWIDSLPGVDVYAKTGTLSTDNGRTDTSRLVLMLVRWKNRVQGEVDRGLVLSLVAERAERGVATEWLGDFLTQNRELLRQVLVARPGAE